MRKLLVTKDDERDKDVERKREKRSEAARIEIPSVVDLPRRERCLKDPELFLKTYFADRYRRPFGRHHIQMIEAIIERAKYGGRQAIAAPRGCGKSELVKGMQVFLVLAELVRFILPVASTTPHAGKLYKDFRKKLATNDMLLADFPEVCYPVRALDGAPARAAKQHIDGNLTGIVWTATDFLSLPHVTESPYGGVKMAYYGLDAAFRGINIDGDRPDFILIDDPETRESAKSFGQIADREAILDQDIAGLAGEDEELAIVLLTTIQNRYCLSFQVTSRDPEHGKPAYNGLRFGMIENWPDTIDDPTDESKLGLWGEYIAKRHADQASGDEHGRGAVQFYLENREAMDAGCEMLTDHFTPQFHDDGTQLTYSALQVAFNKIADTSLSAYRTEYQNDPDPEDEIERVHLTAARVQSRLSGLSQGDVPSDTGSRTIGIDLGKYACHWTDVVWSDENCIATIPDYGIAETIGLARESSNKAIEHAILKSLEQWADEIALPRNPLLVLVDSGTFTQAAYEFCRRMGAPFFPSKGWDEPRFRMPKRNEVQIPFLDAYARYQPEEMVWLYNVQTEAWKKWTQERFLVQTFDDDGQRVPGSLALFETGGDIKRHLSFSHHITSEEEQMIPVLDKAMKRIWKVKNRNNHWLDATALAMAAGGCIGHRLVAVTPPTTKQAAKTKPKPPSKYKRDGRSFLASQR